MQFQPMNGSNLQARVILNRAFYASMFLER